MPEYFIVTVSDGGFETDLEIPSGLPFSEFKGKLLEIMKILGAAGARSWGDHRLTFNGRPLRDSDTLASVGAFDGSLLIIARR
ncbi:MAG: EsaB/YukD family protein [Oscillospiraceae bacterium]|jgi:hypothetical protein|nr:EsaB/YukD family protein [Oscillospiraceae bacterium]